MPLIGAIADDLTGATTTGVLLARSGAKTAAFFNEEAAEECKAADSYGAIIVSSNSRALPADEAYQKVMLATSALKRMGILYFSKRIDTTLRGGVGVEIDAMLDQLKEGTIAVVVPAMPQSKRILVGGFSIIDNVSLIKTPVAQDVRTPVKENYIPRLLHSQTQRKVGLITLDKVLAGTDVIKEALNDSRQSGNQVIVVDAVSIEDVDAIAKACVELKWDVLAVDPGAFTSKLAYHRGLIREEKPNLPDNSKQINQDKTVLIVAGSATPVTKKQMEILCEDKRHIRISAEPVPFIDGGDQALNEIKRVVDLVLEFLNQEKPPRAILVETALHGDLLNLNEEDQKRNYAEGMSANRINASLGTIVSMILEHTKAQSIAGLYTTGGDTMVHVCHQLSVSCIELVDYVIPQTDIGRLVGSYDGMPIVGKGGLTGNDDTACDIVDRLFLEDIRNTINQ